MRPHFLMLAACCAGAATAQSPSGTYFAPNSPPQSWQINEHHTLVWNGLPYLPVGGVIDGSSQEVARLAEAGIRDALVDLPASGTAWKETFEALDKNSFRYLLRVNSMAPMAQGYAVEPQGYRAVGITNAQTITFDIPGCKTALIVIAGKRDSSIVKHERVAVADGKFSYDVPMINGLEHVLLVYPEIKSLEQPDFWEGMDAQRDTLLSSLKRSAPGPGLRGVVNPIGRLLRMPGRPDRFVPNSQVFRDELMIMLERKYRSVETANKAWNIRASDLTTFQALSRLVPLWSGARGVAKLWDPATDRLYDSDQRRSAIWRDINETILVSATKRLTALTNSIRVVSNVPVVQEFAGWAAPYDGASSSFNGLGIQVRGGGGSEVIAAGSRPTSAILRWDRPGWLLATEIDVREDPSTLSGALDDLTDLGARGWFVRASSPEALQSVVAHNSSRSLRTELAQSSPIALFFPENAMNPAFPQRLPGGRWWLPSPVAGDRLDFGTQYQAYRSQDKAGAYVVLWSTRGIQRPILRMFDPKGVTFETLDGSDPKPKETKKGVEVTVSEVPLIIRGTPEIPVPEESVAEAEAVFQMVLKAAGGNPTIEENTYLVAEALKGFDRNPGGNYLQMRDQTNKMLQKVSSILWIEAEVARLTNFSEILPDPSCSAGGALVLDTRVAPNGGTYMAEFSLPVRSNAEQDVWIAARLPEQFRSKVSLLIGGQALSIQGGPTSPYGEGYAWYNLGTTRLAGSSGSLQLTVDAPQGAELAIDAIVLTPLPFRPYGVRIPQPDVPDEMLKTWRGKG